MEPHPPHIQKMLSTVKDKERVLRELKRAVNTFCVAEGLAPVYPDAEDDRGPSVGAIQPDSFYGQPLATSVKRYLEMRRAANQGPSTVADIHDALKEGGFEFGAKNAENAKRSLRISLSKNPAFHRLPNGTYGLTAWYPAVKGTKQSPAEAEDGTEAAENGQEAEDG